jgi:hypothetical protein
MAPDDVVLWVAREDRGRLPRRVEALQEHGLTVGTWDDIRQFKKILPTLATYPDAFILICDDDNFYPPGWLRRFVEEYRDPDEVLCTVARCVAMDPAGVPMPYVEWPDEPAIPRPIPSPAIIPVGTGGVLYPPGSLPEAVSRDFERLCPTSDDLWLWWHFALAGRRARRIKWAGRHLKLPGTQRVALWRRNNAGGANDRQVAAMLGAYGLPFGRTGGSRAVTPRPAPERPERLPEEAVAEVVAIVVSEMPCMPDPLAQEVQAFAESRSRRDAERVANSLRHYYGREGLAREVEDALLGD